MKIEDAVSEVARKFSYTADQPILSLFDHWMVMKEDDGWLSGDCDDFAVTALWKRCDESLLKFILNVMILHKYRLYFAKTHSGERHIVGYADGLFFDNWTKQPLPKEEFLNITKHRIWFFFPSPFMTAQLLLGLIMRNVKR